MAYTIRQYATKAGKRYEVRYRKPDGTPTGKRGFRRKMDAEAWGDQHVTAAKRDGSFVDQSAGRTLVSDIYAEWMDSRRPILKPNTIRTDEATWKTHVEPEYADRQIGSITHRELQAFISGKAEKLAPSTVLKVVGVLKGVCDLAVKDRLIAKAPTDELALPRREGRRLHRYLTVEQLLAVADEAGRARIQPTDRKALVLVLGLCGLGDSIPAEVQGRNFAPLFFDEKAEIVRPTGALYIQNVDGDKDENGLVQTYFPSSRGIKTAQYTLALYIDRDTKQLKKSLLFDDVKDPYQLHNLPLEENKEIVAQLCGEMGAMLKEINDPWYTEKILSDRIPY